MKNIATITYIVLIISLLKVPTVRRQEPLRENNLYVKGILKQQAYIYAYASGGRKVQTLKPFSFVFLYEVAGSFKHQRNGYYQVGLDPHKPPMGWIKASAIEIWDNRRCVNFTPLVGREPTLVKMPM